MLIIPIEEAEPGMKLVMTVSHPEHPEQNLLKPGYTLDGTVIQRLRGLGVPFLYIDYPDLADLDRQLLPHLSPARQLVYSHIRSTIAAIQKTEHPSVTFPDYYIATRQLVLTLLETGQHPTYLDILSGSLGSDAVAHATAVAHLAVTIGIRVEQYIIRQRSRLPARHAREVINLGVAAMLHDLGKTRLPPELQRHTSIDPPEDDQQRDLWESHTQIGADMLRHGIESSAVATVLQHHQRFDGAGFPALARPGKAAAPLAGEQIHIFARILLAADLYERLTVSPNRRRRPPIEVLHLLRTEYGDWIDPYILRILPSVIPPFPPGSRLGLSDGSRAVVITFDPADPYCPTAKRLAEDRLAVVGEPLRLDESCPVTISTFGNQPIDEMLAAAPMEVTVR